MGLLIDGKWHDQWYDTSSTGGKFERSKAQFRNWITKDGASGFKAASGRYHLYVSYACPWAHRTLIYRALKGLENMIDVSFVHWLMGENGWTFDADDHAIVKDHLFNFDYAHQIYTKADPNYSGRVTVPILWDKEKNTIVSNESSEIIRMFNNAFDDIGARAGDYYPASLRTQIDEMNDWIYHDVNNGVYKAGFATSQSAYEEAVYPLFDALDKLEDILSKQRYLLGNQMTEADLRLFPTLYRFDTIYVGHFKCALKRLVDYPNLWGYVRDIYQMNAIKSTVNMEHARRHYYESHSTINPTAVVTIPPQINWDEPHAREGL